MQKTLRLEGMNWHNATNPKLKEGKVRELNPEICPDFFDLSHFGRVFAESGDFLTFWGNLSTGKHRKAVTEAIADTPPGLVRGHT